MTTSYLASHSATSDDALAYLSVDAYLSDAVSTRILQSAIELGLIEQLATLGIVNPQKLRHFVNLDEAAFAFLTQRLLLDKVVQRVSEGLELTPEFLKAWEFRDLIVTKIEFARLVAPDFIDSFTTLLQNPREFFSESYLFSLFDYSRCFENDPDSRMATIRWMRYTTTLTRYEAAVCLSLFDISHCRHMLDLGGNSGELVRQACKQSPSLRATVADLPLVCELGREHVARSPESTRIRFIEGNWLNNAVPGCYDLVCFKSMLHDWPAPEAERFLRNAYESLEPGGTLLIFERSDLTTSVAPLSYGSLPLLLFFQSYRNESEYRSLVEQAGFTEFLATTIDLDTPFLLITARKER